MVLPKNMWKRALEKCEQASSTARGKWMWQHKTELATGLCNVQDEIIYLSSASLLASASLAASVLSKSCCRACCCCCNTASGNGCECCDLMARGRGTCDVGTDAAADPVDDRLARENAPAAGACLAACADDTCDCSSSCSNACCCCGVVAATAGCFLISS